MLRAWQVRADDIQEKPCGIDLLITIFAREQAPAQDLAALYHERWEIEIALDELKTHLRGAQIVLRSKTPELVRQEFFGLLMAHFAIRGLMHEAALKADEDPDRLSFLHSVHMVQRRLAHYTAIPPSAEKSSPPSDPRRNSGGAGGVEPQSDQPVRRQAQDGVASRNGI